MTSAKRPGSQHYLRNNNQNGGQLFALAYNLGNFLRRLALPKPIRHWSLTTLRGCDFLEIGLAK